MTDPQLVRRAIDLLAGRWIPAIIAELDTCDRRYQDLYSALGGISRKVLTETLRRAERDGLITRHLDARHIGTATLYQLTDLGQSLDEPLALIESWVETNWNRVEDARSQWDWREK